MGVISIFSVATSGINAQRVAIEVTGENIANVNTPGYSRQNAILEERPYSTATGFPLGTGVKVAAVERSYDAMLQNQIINGNSTYQQNLTRQGALQQVEPSFNELSSDGLGTTIDKFFDSWQDLSTNAQGTPERQALLVRAQTMVDTFHQMNANLNSVITAADNSLIGITSDITDKVKNIALVNNQILTTNAVGGNANELLDQRDYLTQELAKSVGISYSVQQDGTMSISLAGGGQQLVSGLLYSTVYASPKTVAPFTNDIYVTIVGDPPPSKMPATDTNITATVGGIPFNSQGEIGGTLQIRDSMVPGYLARLDEMAGMLVTSVNNLHTQGYNLIGATGVDFFDPAGVTGATINMAAGMTSTAIAAGFPTVSDPAPTTPGNNVNALSIAALKNTSMAFSGGNSTMGGFYNAMVSTVGIDVQGAVNVSRQGESFLKQLNTLRESKAGVSLDEELTNLIKYQRAYEGSAKLINIATDMLDVVLGIIR
jgi:flagellar hook-associated protein 1 FlgK